MEVVVSKVSSKYVSESLIKELFSMVGCVGSTTKIDDNNTVPSSADSDGSVSYRLTFLNTSEAMKAACLDQVDLADRKLGVKWCDDFRVESVAGKPRLKTEDQVKQCKTLHIGNVDSVEDLLAGFPGILHSTQSTADCKQWLVEFESRAQAMEALIRIRTKRISEVEKYGTITAEEAVRIFFDVTEAAANSTETEKISEHSKERRSEQVDSRQSDRDRSRRGSDDRYSYHSSRYSRDSRDSRDYRRRSRSRSRSPYSRRRRY